MRPTIELNESNLRAGVPESSRAFDPVRRIAPPGDRFRTYTPAVLALWFLLALVASVIGVFDRPDRPPILLGAAALLPPLVFVGFYLRSTGFRGFVLSADLRLLTLAHTWRIGGVVFLVLHRQGVLPGVFALPAGWGDLFIGATAPFVAVARSSGWNLPKPAFVLWHVLGLLDLVVAVSLGILASASPLGVLAVTPTTDVMGRFPLSLIPVFFVPLLIICHLMALARLRNLPRSTTN